MAWVSIQSLYAFEIITEPKAWWGGEHIETKTKIVDKYKNVEGKNTTDNENAS